MKTPAGRIARLTSLVLISAAALAGTARAWNSVGHETVAVIAFNQMQPATRRAVIDILRQHPHFTAHLTDGLGNNPDLTNENVQRHIFAQAATWADWVRPGPLQPNKQISAFHRGSWHYVNFPFVLPADAASFPMMKSSRAIGDGEVLARMAECVTVVKNKKANPQDRAVMLTWFFHLVGDIHQPLHAAALVTKALPEGDRGGNSLGVRERDADKIVRTLHSVWDGLLGSSADDAHVQQIASAIALKFDVPLTPAERGKKRPEKKLPALKTNTSFESWAQESFKIAIASAYLGGSLRYGEPPDREKDTQPDPNLVPVLPANYMDNAAEIARARVALAGCRLCSELENILK